MSDLLIGMFFGALLMAVALFIVAGVSLQGDVIAHGCAHYDSQTGDFTWNDEEKR